MQKVKTDHTILLGDFNAEHGHNEDTLESATGPFGYGERNVGDQAVCY